jgi:SAM-dependent methyltransferase
MNPTEFLAQVEFETVPCDFCGAEEAQVLFEGPDRLHKLPGVFRWVRCSHCGWLRQNPRPTRDTIGAYYPAEYEPYIKAVDDEPSRWRVWERRYGMVKRCRAVTRYQPGGRLLEVGCATGNFMYEMKRLGGWEVYGIEPNEQAAMYARQRFGFDVHVGTLQDVDLPPSSFDVVALWNVLEHLHTPRADLIQVHRLLKDEGLLVFSIPNLEGLGARLFGALWLGWDLPRHLYLSPRRVLIKSLNELGFTVEAMKCLSGSHSSFGISLRFYLEERFPSRRWPRRLLQAYRSLPVRVLAGPFFWLVNQANLAPIITVLARKTPR